MFHMIWLRKVEQNNKSRRVLLIKFKKRLE